MNRKGRNKIQSAKSPTSDDEETNYKNCYDDDVEERILEEMMNGEEYVNDEIRGHVVEAETIGVCRSTIRDFDLKGIVANISNCRSNLMIPENMIPFDGGKVINLHQLPQPPTKMMLHQKIGFLMFELLKKMTKPANEIQKFTFRTRRMGMDQSDSDNENAELDQERFTLIPKKITDQIFQIFTEYCGLDKPIYATGVIPMPEIEKESDFVSLGSSLEERTNTLRRRKAQLLTLTNFVIPTKLKTAAEEIRGCTVKLNEVGELEFKKRDRRPIKRISKEKHKVQGTTAPDGEQPSQTVNI